MKDGFVTCPFCESKDEKFLEEFKVIYRLDCVEFKIYCKACGACYKILMPNNQILITDSRVEIT